MAERPQERRFLCAVDPQTPPEGLDRAIVAIGNFDGIHRGHKAVIEAAKRLAAARGRPCAVVTFEPHPSDYFDGAGTIFRLTPLAAKARFLQRLGLDGVIVFTFGRELATTLASEFVANYLVRRLNVAGVVVGYDFHFGKMRGGTPAVLAEAGKAHGFEVEIVARLDADAEGLIETASSTATRAALERGDVRRAAKLLGHPYEITGTVIAGQKLGRTLGFPTANIAADPSCRLRHGIYAVRVDVDENWHDGVASFGRRPTVDNGAPLLEVFLFDFAGDLYGKLVDVAFIEWLRAEEKFESLEALTQQMQQDLINAKSALAAAS